MTASLKHIARQLPGIRSLAAQRDASSADAERMRAELTRLTQAAGFVPPGHFYSPIPSADEISRDEARIFGPAPRELGGIDLADEAQLALLRSFDAFYDELPFGPGPREGLRYYYENPAYSYSDGIFLHCMIRHLRPARIIEVGSGYSSCMILDTNDLCFDGAIETTFVEPYPDLLQSLLTDADRNRVRILPARVQDVDLDQFASLEAGDILFIDSTHVSKIGSDVNWIIFEILPRLAPGVQVHFHDIYFPFEYPQVWIREGRAWNEAYLLRAFLQFNSAFDVTLMSTYMQHNHREFFAEHMPLCLENPGGNIWIRRTAN